jgi:hypothetical protein
MASPQNTEEIVKTAMAMANTLSPGPRRLGVMPVPVPALMLGVRLGKQKQRPAHDDALRGLAGTMASPQIMCIRAKADIVEKPKPEPSH